MTDKTHLSSQPRISLSPAHAVALETRLLTLEDDCREIERYLDGFEGVYFAYMGTLSEAGKRAARATLKEILRCLSALRSDLALRRKQADLRKLLEARLSRMWVTLHETKAEQLRGYGKVPEELPAYLDRRVDQLLRHTSRLRRICVEDRAT
jgi:hypothetical protein